MTAWITIIGYVFQLIVMIVQNKFEKDKAKQAEKDALHAQATTAIKTGNLSLVNSVFDQLRK